jgi:hypothetical protein
MYPAYLIAQAGLNDLRLFGMLPTLQLPARQVDWLAAGLGKPQFI